MSFKIIVGFSFAVCLLSYLLFPVSSAVLVIFAQTDPTLVGYWSFGEGQGDIAGDASGACNHGAVVRATWTTEGEGAGALHFNGQDNRVVLPNMNIAGDQMTVAALIKADSFDHLSWHDARIVSKATDIGEPDHYWMLSTMKEGNSTRLRFRLKAGDSTKTLIADSGNLDTRKWIHVAAVYNGAYMTIYKNGEQVGRTSHSGQISANQNVGVWIGDNPPNAGDRPFHGIIDEVRIYERALTQNEIEALVPEDLVDMSPQPLPDPSAGFVRSIISERGGRTAIGDISGDGYEDVVVHTWGSNRGSVADGTLTWYRYPDWQQHLIKGETKFFGDAVIIADLDDDGENDVVTSRGNDNLAEVWWYKNPGGGTGEWVESIIGTIETGSEVKDIEVHDMDGDGKLDIVVRTKSFFAVYYQDAPDSWHEVKVPNSQREGMAVADVDGDELPDIIFNGFWRENTGGRTTNWPRYDIDDQWFSDTTGGWQDYSVMVDAGDIDGDGQINIVLSHSEKPGFYVTWYATSDPKGGPSAWTAHPIAIVDYAHSLKVADFDNNGLPDIMVGSLIRSSSPATYILYNQNYGESWVTKEIADNPVYKASVGDIDKDGDLDIVSATTWEDGPVRLFRNMLDPTPLNQWRRHLIDVLPEQATFVKHADLTGNGHMDLVAGRWWWENPGMLGGEWTRKTIGSPLNNAALVYDFDGDGLPDIFGTQGTGANPNSNLAWARNNGDGTFTVMTNIESGGSGDFLQGVLIGDFGYGTQIILSWHNGGGGVHAITLPDNPANETWGFSTLSTTTQKEDLSMGDINRDGRPDILLGTIWLENKGDGTWAPHTIGTVASGEPDRNALVDINNDGRLDVVVGLENGTDLYWFEAPEDPVSDMWTRHTIAEVGGQGFSLDVADFAGNGRMDVVLGEHRGSEENRVIVFENVDGGATWNPIVIDSDSRLLIDHHDGTQVADLNGNGALDIYSIGWTNPKLWVYENLSGGSSTPPSLDPDATWWDAAWAYRVGIELSSSGVTRDNVIAEVAINFTESVRNLGSALVFDPNSLRLIEVDEEGEILDTEVPFQFDQAQGYDAGTNAVGTFVWEVTGNTPDSGMRFYHVYFDDIGKEHSAVTIPNKISYIDEVLHEGYDSYRIETQNAIYYYHKAGGGFASILDTSGRDWVSFTNDSGSGASGWFRGVPNAVYPEDVFHPGRDTGTSSIAASGPIRLTIESVSGDGVWKARWFVYPKYARMVMLLDDHDYWFQYEGTPGGETQSTDTLYISDGTSYEASTTGFTRDILGEEWMYVADTTAGGLFLAHHEGDEKSERWYQMAGPSGNPEGMVIAAFGRAGVTPLLSGRHTFTIGLLDETVFTSASRVIRSAYKDLQINVHSAQKTDPGSNQQYVVFVPFVAKSHSQVVE